MGEDQADERMAQERVAAVEAAPDPSFGLLYLGPLISYGDRFAIPPILVSIGRDLDESLAAVASVASLYFLLYGVIQPVYGVLSDRVGRVRVMRVALVGMGIGNLVAAVAPTLGTLVAAKAVTGAFAGGILPTCLVYVGDRLSFDRRQHAIANVLSAGAVGTVAGSIGAGMFGRFSSWRLVFVVPAVLALGVAVALGRLPESKGEVRGAGPITQIRRVARHPWALFLLLLAVGEGAVVLGFLTYLAPALEAAGESAAVAGTVVAAYGAAVFLTMQVVKHLVRARSVAPPRLIAGGGALLVLAYLVAASGQTVPNILGSSLLIGASFAFLHSTMQTWATEVAPEARGTAISFFVTGVFSGAALGTAAVSGLAGQQRFGALFFTAAVITVPVVLVASLARARFRSHAVATPPP